MSKKYKVGMYGGKFMPFHKGHLYCTLKAASECDTLYLLLMYGGKQEEEILSEYAEEYLMPQSRFKAVVEAVRDYPNILPIAIDVSRCRSSDGSESWEMETPLVRKACGLMDAIYGSEEEYRKYFEHEYPEAKYVIIDEERTEVPISGTAIRNMTEEERKEWIV